MSIWSKPVTTGTAIGVACILSFGSAFASFEVAQNGSKERNQQVRQTNYESDVKDYGVCLDRQSARILNNQSKEVQRQFLATARQARIEAYKDPAASDIVIKANKKAAKKYFDLMHQVIDAPIQQCDKPVKAADLKSVPLPPIPKPVVDYFKNNAD
jgi:hypothetical protein